MKVVVHIFNYKVMCDKKSSDKPSINIRLLPCETHTITLTHLVFSTILTRKYRKDRLVAAVLATLESFFSKDFNVSIAWVKQGLF